MTQTMKPGEWGTKDGEPAVSWWRHGQAAQGEPSIVTEVRTYATEVERVEAVFPQMVRNPNDFLLAEYSKYEKDVAEGDPMEFDDWLVGSDLPEIVMARELANSQERKMKIFQGTAYFATRQAAEENMATLPPFAPSKYLSKTEIERGAGLAQVREFGRGFAIQLGDCGNYFPSTTTDGETQTQLEQASA